MSHIPGEEKLQKSLYKITETSAGGWGAREKDVKTKIY